MFDLANISSGTAVPAVEPSDFAAVLKLMTDFENTLGLERGQRAIGLNVYQAACSAGADVVAVWFRAANLILALQHGDFTEFVHEGKFKDSFLRLWATFPFKAVDVQTGGSFHLNRDDFNEALRKLHAG